MIDSVKSPIWADPDNTLINVLITTSTTGVQELPFTASSNDTEEIGRQIYQQCIDGLYGPIAPYIPPQPLPVPPPTAEQNKQTAMTLLQQTDWVVLSDVDNPTLNPHLLNKADFVSYREALRQIAVYPEPGVLEWPTKPNEQWSE